MLHSVIGDDLFYGGLNNYLKKRMFSNANDQDLWNDMQEYIENQTVVDDCVGIDIKGFMDPYVLQMGLPVLNVSDPSGEMVCESLYPLMKGVPRKGHIGSCKCKNSEGGIHSITFSSSYHLAVDILNNNTFTSKRIKEVSQIQNHANSLIL